MKPSPQRVLRKIYKLICPFQLMAERRRVPDGRSHRDMARTFSRLVSQLFFHVKTLPAKDEEDVDAKPVKITSHRLSLTFHRAKVGGSENLPPESRGFSSLASRKDDQAFCISPNFGSGLYYQ